MTATLDRPVAAPLSPALSSTLRSAATEDGPSDGEREALRWTAHPLIDRIEGGRYRAFSPAEIARLLATGWTAEDIAEHWDEREQRLKLAESDPLHFGFELPHWDELRHVIKSKLLTGILGANNSAKSWFFGKLACETLTGIFDWPSRYPGPVRVLMVAQDEGASLQYQQTAVYAHLPPAMRSYNTKAGKKRTAVTKIAYSQANGFTEGTFVLPRRQQCWFKTVAQYTRDPNSFEGPSYHLVLADEGLPLPLLELLLVRAAKVGGKVCLAHTNIHGLSAVAARLLSGARVVKSLPMQWDWLYVPSSTGGNRGNGETKRAKGDKAPEHVAASGSDSPNGPSAVAEESCLTDAGARPGNNSLSVPSIPSCSNSDATPGGINPALEFPELKPDEVHVKGCPPGHFPFLMQPLDFNHGLVFTWCHWNPFQPTGTWRGGRCPAIFDTCPGQPKWKVRVKLFGWIERLIGAAIGNFDPNVHVLPHEKILEILRRKKFTLYHHSDPHVARSYFHTWRAVDEDDIGYTLEECPNVESEGEWVDANGDPGEGTQVYASAGTVFYKRLIRQRERMIAEWTLRPGETLSAAHERCEALRRFGDPRAFATQAAAAAGGTSLFELFWADDGEAADPDLRPMAFEPAKIRGNTTDRTGLARDLEHFVTRLSYDREKPITIENQPREYVSDRCQNLIRALIAFDGDPDSPHKDPIDAGARYGFCEPTPFVDVTASAVQGGGAMGAH